MALNYKEAADCLRDGAHNYHTEEYIQAYGMAIDVLEALNKLNVVIIVEKDSMGHYTNFEISNSSHSENGCEQLKDNIKALRNRCFVLTKGVMCDWCNQRNECHMLKNSESEEV